MTLTNLFIKEFGERKLEKLSPRVKELFRRIDALHADIASKAHATDKKAASKR